MLQEREGGRYLASSSNNDTNLIGLGPPTFISFHHNYLLKGPIFY